MRAAIKDKVPIIYVDETMFTKRTIKGEAYSGRHSNIRVKEEDVMTPYVAAIAAVSKDRGLDLLQTFSGPVNTESFTAFVERLQLLRPGQEIAIFMDQARYHVSFNATLRERPRNLRVIFNVAWSPQYNPIEGCFSVVKNHFKRARLNALSQGRPFIFQRAINEAFKQLTVKKVANYVRGCMKTLKVPDGD